MMDRNRAKLRRRLIDKPVRRYFNGIFTQLKHLSDQFKGLLDSETIPENRNDLVSRRNNFYSVRFAAIPSIRRLREQFLFNIE